jgi:hypothetical protein
MRSLFHLAPASFFAAATLLAQQAALPPTPEAILNRYVQVTGGREAYDKVKSLTMMGTMEIKGQGVRGELKMYRAEGGKYYTVIDLGGMGKQEDGSDGATAWDKTVLGPRIKSGVEKFLATCADGVMSEYGKAALELGECYSKAEYAGEETIDGKKLQKLVLTPKEGKPEEQYYDRETGLLARVKLVMPSPMGEVPITTIVSDYKTVSGLQVPGKLANQMGPIQMEMTFTTITVNDQLPEQLFALPPEIKALVGAQKPTGKK